MSNTASALSKNVQSLSFKQALLLSFPILLSNATYPLVGLVDSWILGQLNKPEALAGVALAVSLVWIIFGSFNFLRYVTGGEVAQAVGARQQAAVTKIIMRALITALVVSAVILLLSPILAPFMTQMVTQDAQVSVYTQTYLQVRLYAMPATLINMVIIAAYIGFGDTRTVFLLQLLLNISNIIMSLYFVQVLQWGVFGVALGTALAETLSMFVGLALLLPKLNGVRQALASLKNWAAFKQPAIQGMDMLMRTAVLECVYLLFFKMSGDYSTVGLAINALLLGFHSFAAYALDSFAYTLESYAGRAIGAKNKALFYSALYKCSLLALAMAIILGLAFLQFGAQFISFMSVNADIRANALDFIAIAALMPLVSVASFMLDGLFFGATMTRALNLGMLASALGFYLLTLVLMPLAGVHGLWLAMMAFFLLRALTLALYLPALLRKHF